MRILYVLGVLLSFYICASFATLHSDQAYPSIPEFSASSKPSTDAHATSQKADIKGNDGQLVSSRVYMTLATNVEYAMGAMVLAGSLRLAGTKHPIVLMATKHVVAEHLAVLSKLFNRVVEVDPVPCEICDPPVEYFTKLRAWQFVEYERIIYIGADQVALKNLDHLFECIPPCAPYDFFLFETSILGTTVNGDFIVLKPSIADFDSLALKARKWNRSDEFLAVPQTWSHSILEKVPCRRATYLGTYDQALLNRHYAYDWTILPYYYNFAPSTLLQEADCDRAFLFQPERIKVVHYTFHKPWAKYLHPGMRQFFNVWVQVALAVHRSVPFEPLNEVIERHKADIAELQKANTGSNAEGSTQQQQTGPAGV